MASTDDPHIVIDDAEASPITDPPSPTSIIASRISAFVPPPGFVVFKPKRTDDSIAYSYGVRVVNKEGAFYCLATEKCDSCNRRFSVKKSLSVATTHLQHVHVFNTFTALLVLTRDII